MNYIGSKHSLIPFIQTTLQKTVASPLDTMVFCDLFAGTGAVARAIKPQTKQVIANDIEYYSYVLNKNYIGNHLAFEYQPLLDELNQLPLKKGFVFENYSENGKAQRLYFSAHNGQKIDSIRTQIESWFRSKKITQSAYFFLLASLLESADKVANTASVYGAYLKQLKKSAQQPLYLAPALFDATPQPHLVYNEDSNDLITKISGDILYLDPPYNARQYGANYHLLNTIALYDTFIPQGKTGLRLYHKSVYCKKQEVALALDNLIEKAQFTYIFLSYNNEGLLPSKTIETIFKKYGHYDVATQNYSRFKADKTENRHHKATSTTEFLHILEKKF